MQVARKGMGFALAALVLGAEPAAAVVGGRDGGQPGSSVMVLNARGGVCTGIVVSRQAVLTAAHCVDGTEARVHWQEAGQPVLVVPATVGLHPGYERGAISARKRSIDLALVRLAEPLPARFTPATLSDGGTPRAGSAVALGGYGVSREGEARTTGTWRNAGLVAVEPYGPGRVLLWAADPEGGGKSPGAGACQGDSGGPMTDAGGAVSAVTSWSTGPGKQRCGLLTQGILVGPQRGWIDRTLSGWGEAARWNAGG